MMSRRPFSFMHHTIFRNHPKAGESLATIVTKARTHSRMCPRLKAIGKGFYGYSSSLSSHK